MAVNKGETSGSCDVILPLRMRFPQFDEVAFNSAKISKFTIVHVTTDVILTSSRHSP